MQVKGKKIFVGLSGGVDSAVSAALLQQAGADVTGVFIKGWYPPGMPCTWAEDRRDAMRVAAHLRIPFRTLDAAEEYKRNVIEYLLAEYRAGRTPNPDVMCNRDIKFGVFYQYALSEGADGIATGHYLTGEKDQRYFLWAVPQNVLQKTVFPVGGMDKSKVRRLARRFKLPVAEKKDSQGVCFLGSISVEEFLTKTINQRPGKAYTPEMKEVGIHAGALLYTIGERVPLFETKMPGPWFVQNKDPASNTLIVANTPFSATLQNSSIPFKEAVWRNGAGTVTGAQYRYRGPLIEGRIDKDAFIAKLPLPEAPAPGQSLVFYDGETVVGGAIIS